MQGKQQLHFGFHVFFSAACFSGLFATFCTDFSCFARGSILNWNQVFFICQRPPSVFSVKNPDGYFAIRISFFHATIIAQQKGH
nr:MAG TPA: hypothetical protein [Caudoviricetes sp.]